MASNYTEHYDLCQWEATDQVQRTDFNADNAKIDAALDALAGQVAEKADGDDLISLGQMVEQKAEISELTELDGRALRWALGSYVGTGTCGSDSPNQLDFSKTLGRAPVFLLVRKESDNSTTKSPVLAAVRGVKYCSVYPSLINTGGATCSMTWSGTSVQWYGSAAVQQMNEEGDKYFYLAIG